MDTAVSADREQAINALHAATAIYTAEPVVEELLNAVDWPRGNRRLVDPSCGDGVFLIGAMERLLRHRPDIDESGVADLLQGWELHPAAARQARNRVASMLMGRGWPSNRAVAAALRMVRNADFLTEGPSGSYCHVIAGNPPYLRFTNVPELLRQEYQAALPSYARADLLHAFLDRCASALLPDGEIALVTADRWLFNVGASRLREALGNRLAIATLRRLDPSTAFYRPKDRSAGSPPRIHPVAVVMRPPSPAFISLGAAPIFPDRMMGFMEVGEGRTLGEIASVSLAPWLGTKGVFVVGRETASKLPAEHLVPAIDTDDIRDGQLQEPTRYAIRTSPDCSPPQAIMDHLEANRHRMAKRGLRKTPWLPPESWHKRPLDKPLLLVPRIARSLRPVRVPPGVLPINHNLSIVAAGKWSLDEIEYLLLSKEANDWMRAHAARLEDGFFSLTTRLLRQLPA